MVQSGQSEVRSLQGNFSSAAGLLGFKLVVISKGLLGMHGWMAMMVSWIPAAVHLLCRLKLLSKEESYLTAYAAIHKEAGCLHISVYRLPGTHL